MYFICAFSPYKLCAHFSNTQQILIRTEKLLQSGTILETLKHTDHGTINTLMGKIKQLMTDFDDRLGKRKKKIDESVQLHKLTEMVSVGMALPLNSMFTASPPGSNTCF